MYVENGTLSKNEKMTFGVIFEIIKLWNIFNSNLGSVWKKFSFYWNLFLKNYHDKKRKVKSAYSSDFTACKKPLHHETFFNFSCLFPLFAFSLIFCSYLGIKSNILCNMCTRSLRTTRNHYSQIKITLLLIISFSFSWSTHSAVWK